MTAEDVRLIRGLAAGSTRPVRRVLEGLLLRPRAVNLERLPFRQPVSEVMGVWQVRLWNAMLQGRRFAGLTALVRALRQMAPLSRVEQLTVSVDSISVVMFRNAEDGHLIGAVVGYQHADRTRRARPVSVVEEVPPFLTHNLAV